MKNVRNRIIWALSLAFGLSCLIATIPASSVAQITFEKTYGGSSIDRGYAVQQTQDGGYIIAGWTKSFGAGQGDVYLIKTDSLGSVLWDTTYGGGNRDVGRSVHQTLDGGYIVAGWTESFGSGSLDVYLVKTDSLGKPLWDAAYGGPDLDWAGCVQQTRDAGYIIVGYTMSFGAGGKDLYLIKTDSSGNTLWDTTYGGSSDDWGYSVQQTLDGGYIIAGGTKSFGVGSLDVYVVKTDSLGNRLWGRTHGGGSYDIGNSVHQTLDGGFAIAGITASFGAGLDDIYLLKMDSLGTLLWHTTYGGTSADWGYSVQQTLDGGYVVTGATWSFGAGMIDVYLVKTDSVGNAVWDAAYGGAGFDYGLSVRQTQDGGYIIVGYTSSFGAGSSDVYIIKTDADGVVSVEEDCAQSEVRTSRVGLLQNIPNPFQGSTKISYSLTVSGHITVQVLDITGRAVETLVDRRQRAGIHHIRWNGRDAPTGVYFCRLQAGDSRDTKKMILIR